MLVSNPPKNPYSYQYHLPLSFLEATLTDFKSELPSPRFFKEAIGIPSFVLGFLEATTDCSDYLHLQVVADSHSVLIYYSLLAESVESNCIVLECGIYWLRTLMV
jgi:hypothetical protein